MTLLFWHGGICSPEGRRNKASSSLAPLASTSQPFLLQSPTRG